MFPSAFSKRLLFFLVSVLGAGYVFAGGSGDFPEAFVASYDAGSGIAQIAIDWKKVRPDDKRQFGLYRSTGENADTYTLLTTLNTSIVAYTDSNLHVDTEYHYIIGSASPRKVLPDTKVRKKKERRTELSNPRGALSYGNVPAGPIALIPSEEIPDQPPVSTEPTVGDISRPDQPGDYRFAPAQSGAYQPSSVQSGNDQVLIQSEVTNIPPVFPYHEPVRNFAVPEWEPAFQNGGVFFTMGYFSNRVFELTERPDNPGVVSLIDSDAKSRLVSLFQQSYVRSTIPGTSLFYAIHNAISRINSWNANGALSDFDMVLLVTITDGLDTSSTDPTLEPIDGLTFRNANTYQNFIKNTIQNSRIGGKKITTVSIGIRGTDTVTEQEYVTTLRSVANAEENVYRIPLRNLTKTLQTIAASVTDGMAVHPFGFVTPAFSDGTEIFIALDGFSTPPRGQNFIAGRIKTRENQLTLENISLGGMAKEITPVPKGSVTGLSESNGSVEWLFNFSEALRPSRVVLYYKTGRDWHRSKEFTVHTYSPVDSHRSVLVYLLIDNSVSMSNQNITAIRDSASQFIEALSVNPASVRPVFSDNTVFVMTRIPGRSDEPELAATVQSPQARPQWENPPLPENRADENTWNGAEARSGYGNVIIPKAITDRTGSPPATAVPVIPPIPQPIPGGRGYWVQASSSENRAIAEDIIAQLRQYQLAPVITEVQVRGKTFYRVRIGPYDRLAEAEAVADFIKKPPLGFYDSFIP
jgi:hypothetical protein